MGINNSKTAVCQNSSHSDWHPGPEVPRAVAQDAALALTPVEPADTGGIGRVPHRRFCRRADGEQQPLPQNISRSAG